MKKIANSLFGAPNCRPFGEIGGLPRPWPNRPSAEKKIFLRHTFLPKWTQKKFRPKRMKGGRVIRPFIYHRVTESQSHRVTESQSHRVTESQSHRVTESQSHATSTPYTGGWNFLCPFSINSPTRFARRGINLRLKRKILGEIRTAVPLDQYYEANGLPLS